MHRTNNVWPLYVSLQKQTSTFQGWANIHWQIEAFISADKAKPEGAKLVFLELFQDERASYRLNLDLDQPKLFIVCDELADGQWLPMSVTAEQSIATACLESDTPVLSLDMPDAIACWIEAFITLHGEVEICAHRRKHVNRKKEQSNGSVRRRR
ncbi:DUF3305 domain-containing protein [Thalassotalea sp. Y01]|uniref:DUF3305 domain-containing protein n=1 Tax=Thalassotalea sp. Y01 TaxID=2729613 RepID=UPI00145CE4DC|nr:DUF3305 domain-containing protein [Thalassotalea sp. Y01]NMP17268.1 DUF3305 domain-containing protein [Thalassotalea sp. Y01]